jgi:hypothetical protein
MRQNKERLQAGRKIFQFSFFLTKRYKKSYRRLNELERKNKKQKGYGKDKNHQLRLFFKLHGNFRATQYNNG